MQALKAISLRPKTQTVSVYTRHSADCPKKGEPQWRRCKCAKYLYLLRDGKNKTISAKTRSWEKAEQQAQEIRESWDPVKQKLRELDELTQARELGEVTITYALERWLASVKADSDSGNEHTHSKYQTAEKHIGAPERLSLNCEGRWNTDEISLAPIARHLCCYPTSERNLHARSVQDAGTQIGKDYGEVLFAVGS
jgi:hypothetical protein